jgi:hypothetical protein
MPNRDPAAAVAWFAVLLRQVGSRDVGAQAVPRQEHRRRGVLGPSRFHGGAHVLGTGSDTLRTNSKWNIPGLRGGEVHQVLVFASSTTCQTLVESDVML